jgi:hypothetical protein
MFEHMYLYLYIYIHEYIHMCMLGIVRSKSGEASPLRGSMRQSYSKDLLNNAVSHNNSHLLRKNEQSELGERSSKARISMISSTDLRSSLMNSIKKNSNDAYTDNNDLKSIKKTDNLRSHRIMSDPRWSVNDISIKNKISPTKNNTVYPIDTYEFNKSKIFNKTGNTVFPGDVRQHHIQKASSVENDMDWKLPKEVSVVNESKENEPTYPSPASSAINSYIRRTNSVNNGTTSLSAPVKKPYEFGKRASAKFVTTDCIETTKPSNVPKLILPGSYSTGDMKHPTL